MNANRHFDDDDLILYALHLLGDTQYDAVAQFVATDPSAQARLLELRHLLGLYAEVVVQPTEAPAGSRERLLQNIAREPVRQGSAVPARTPALPFPAPASASAKRGASVLSWVGWAVAAVLAITLGVLGQRWFTSQRTLTSVDAQLASLTTDAANLRDERNRLQSDLQDQRTRATALEHEAAQAQNGAATLQSKTQILQSKAESLQSKAATLQSQLAGQNSRLSQEAARATQAEQTQIALQEALAEQREQLAQASAATENAQVLAALADPAALRVVLTKPKSKPAPSGRAAYVLNKGTLVFLGNNLAALKPTQVYELWLLPADGSNPVAAGTFEPDARGNATLTVAHFPRAVRAKGFAVTVEATGGSSVPTLPLFLVGS